MALDLWFREDLLRILTALASAGEAHGDEYRRALADVGLALGITATPAQPRPTGPAPYAQRIEGKGVIIYEPGRR